MELKPFSQVLADALTRAAAMHGKAYADGGAEAWGITGASYLGFALCGLPASMLRSIQYSTRDQFGPVILDCKWYDGIKDECLDGRDAVDTLLPAHDGTLQLCSVSATLFLEMLDFCREG
jgi:hypothetical protein